MKKIEELSREEALEKLRQRQEADRRRQAKLVGKLTTVRLSDADQALLAAIRQRYRCSASGAVRLAIRSLAGQIR